VETRMKKCQIYQEWCKKQGIFMPKLEYPAFFEDGTMGFKAKEAIKHRELIMAVPYSIVMSNHKAKENPELNKIFIENVDIFETSDKNDHNNFLLTVFLMYEL
jgi:hypothetical protein